MIGRGRITRKLNEILKEEFSKGRVPPTADVASRINTFASEKDLEAPFFEPPEMGYRSRFNVDVFNDAVSGIYEDVETIYEEDVHITSDLLSQLSLQDAVYRSQMSALKVSESQLGDLLLTSPQGGAALLSVYDDFGDFSKVDRDNTTAYVDLNMSNVGLNPNKAATKRVRLSHLAKLGAFDVDITEPGGEPPIQQQIPGSKAGAIFDDTGAGWQFRVFPTDGYKGRVEIEFTFNLSETEEDVYFSRIDLETMSIGETDVQILATRDNVNWLTPPGYNEKMIVGTAPITMRFPAIRAKAIKIRLSKPAPDGSDKIDLPTPPESRFVSGVGLETEPLPAGSFPYYHFGIKSLALYKMGYDVQAVLRSIPLYPDVTGFPYGKASLYVDEDLPEDTDIKYHLAIPSDSPEWVEIAPMNRDVEGIPKIVDFGNLATSPRHDNHFVIPSGINLYATGIKGIDFYNIAAVDANVVHGTAKMWRGVNAWTRTVNRVKERSTSVGCQVHFSMLDRFQYLYLTAIDEEPKVLSTGVVGPGGFAEDSCLELEHIILTDPEGTFEMVPPRGSRGPDIPSYSIEKIVHVNSDSYGSSSVDLQTGATIQVIPPKVTGSKRIVRMTLPSPIGFEITWPVVYLDYTADGRTIRGTFKILGSNRFDAPATDADVLLLDDPRQILRNSDDVDYAASYSDLTHLVTRIDGNKVYINKVYPYIVPGEKILVTYRHVMDESYELITDSIAARPNNAPTSTPYVLGKDYSIDSVDKSIRHLQSGRIPISGFQIDGRFDLPVSQPTILTVSFEYYKYISGRHAYSTYYVLGEPLKRLQLAALNLNADEGDRLHLIAGSKVFDMTEGDEAVNVPPGPVQVIVRSTDLLRVDGTLDINSAVYKVMNAVDEDGSDVFRKGARYWRRQAALLEPMQQVSYHDLTRSVSKDDRRFFAILDGEVWINYDPLAEHDVLSLDWTVDPPLYSNDAEFEMTYRYALASGPYATGILFRALLSRDPDYAEGDVTPLLDGYSIRFV